MSASTPRFDLNTDITLGGDNASNYTAVSQKAIKYYVDHSSGGIVVDQTFDPTSINALSGVAVANANFMQNIATGSNSITIDGVASSLTGTINIGASSIASGASGIAIGWGSSASTSSIGIGTNAKATGDYAIQLGYGTNSVSSTFSVGFNAAQAADRTNWELLNGVTGLIPDARLSSNIQRTLVSGTSIKTINSTSLLGSGDIVVQPVISSSAMLSSDLVDDTNHTHKFATSAQLTQISTNTGDISTINGKIPSEASSTNQLADKAFVNSTIQTNTANFRGNWTTWSAVPSSSSSYPVDYAGSTTPTVNDYLVVQDASDYTGSTLEGTWRFKYSGIWSTDGKSGWLPEYQVNETPLTSAQLAALDSGITSSGVALINTALQPTDVDNTTISINSSDKLQTIGIINQNSGSLKMWTGTRAQYDALNVAYYGYTMGALPMPPITSYYATTSATPAVGDTIYSIIDGEITPTQRTIASLGDMVVAFTDDEDNDYFRYTDGDIIVSNIDANTQYTCTDTGEIYLGTILIANKSGNRNIGEIVASTLPLIDAGLHLLDGSLISGGGMYEDFVTYIAGLYGDGTDVPSYFTTEANWQSTYATYGECGKFVFTPASGDDPATVRLPKVTGILEGTTTLSELGNIIAAGLPSINHTHTGTLNTTGAHTHTRGTMEITGIVQSDYQSNWKDLKLDNKTNAFYVYSSGTEGNGGSGADCLAGFRASRSWTGSTSSNGEHTHTLTLNNNNSVNSIYGNASTVQPQVIKCFVYIVVATSTKTEIEVDIDQIATDVNTIATDLNNTKVSKSGDTMTGALAFERDASAAINYKRTDYTIGDSASGTQINMSAIATYDLNGSNVSVIQTRALDDGSTGFQFALRKHDLSGYHSFGMNETTSGTAEFYFPKSYSVDGQWVNVNQVIASDVNFNTGGAQTKTYSLASYLPNDNYTYEVLFTLGGQTAATSGASFSFALMTDIVSNVFVCRNIARSNAYVFAYGAAIVPLNTRQIGVIQANNSGGTPTMSLLRICAYRRVGTNA